jgi:hypothetical protein
VKPEAASGDDNNCPPTGLCSNLFTFQCAPTPGSPRGKAAFDGTVFGFAEGDSVASVYYGRVASLAQGFDEMDWEIPLILGAAIAHELGHLLLGTNSHSPTGIMCGQWDRRFLRLALMGRQLFTPQQAEVIRAAVDRRNHIEVAGDH